MLDLQKYFSELVDPVYRKFNTRIVNTSMMIYGVRASDFAVSPLTRRTHCVFSFPPASGLSVSWRCHDILFFPAKKSMQKKLWAEDF